MLLSLALGLALGFFGMLLIAKLAELAMRRLGLELFGALVWLGLADPPKDELSQRRELAPS